MPTKFCHFIATWCFVFLSAVSYSDATEFSKDTITRACDALTRYEQLENISPKLMSQCVTKVWARFQLMAADGGYPWVRATVGYATFESAVGTDYRSSAQTPSVSDMTAKIPLAKARADATGWYLLTDDKPSTIAHGTTANVESRKEEGLRSNVAKSCRIALAAAVAAAQEKDSRRSINASDIASKIPV